ncbi:MAG: diguanylate cyclase [Terracidiphilus sp.]|jgi:PAS domain S-box-containing protein
MTDRTELLEAALDSLPDGVCLLGGEGEVMFWNQAAQGITGYPAIELMGHPMPEDLEPLLADGSGMEKGKPPGTQPENHRSVKPARHKMGHCVPVITNSLVLLNRLGERIGAAVLFHPVESQDALPQSETSEASEVAGARADLLERLQIDYDDFTRGGAPLGILRVHVDQAPELRKTHGVAACQAMLEKVYHAIAHGLRPGEEIGYWSGDGFLVIAHERSAEMLTGHAQMLAGLARTADFRWWGDRVSLTVSIGAAQAASDERESLTRVLRRVREAVEISIREGGNRATFTAAGSGITDDTQEGSPCLPS